jgi:hypothetical protein
MKRDVMVFGLAAFLSLLLSPILFAPPVDAQTTLWDDFSGTALDPAKWIGSQAFSATGVSAGWGLELVREIPGDGPYAGTLHLSHRVIGSPFADSANPGSTISRNRMQFTTSQIFHAVQFDLQVLGFGAIGCPAVGSAPSQARARFFAFFFHDPAFPGANLTGNIGAVIELARSSTSVDAPDVLRAQGIVFRCQDAACAVSNPFSIVDLGPAHLGTWGTLTVAWNQDNKSFDFQLNSEPVQSINYAQAPFFVTDDSKPPTPTGLIANAIEARVEGANCTAAIGSTGAQMDALFANVYVTP